jgi:hypothetical protein
LGAYFGVWRHLAATALSETPFVRTSSRFS